MNYEQTKDLKTPNYYQDENGEDLFSKFENGLLSKDEYIGFLKGNAFKYLERYNLKNQKKSDLYKLKDYINTIVNLKIFYDSEYLKLVKPRFELEVKNNEVKNSIFKYLGTINRLGTSNMEEKQNLVLLVLLVEELINLELGVNNY